MNKSITDNEYIKMTLALFCEGIIELNNNLMNKNTTIPLSLEKSLDVIKCLCIINDIEFDSSFNGLYNLVSKPIKDWGMPFIEDVIDDESMLNIILYNKKYKLMGEGYNEEGILTGAIKLKNSLSVDSVEEYFRLSKPFYELREKLTQKDYEIFRTFMQGKSVFDFDELEEALFEISDSKHIKFIKDNFIAPIDNSVIYDGVIHECVNCGFPMRKNSQGELCCNFNKCTENKTVRGVGLHNSNLLKVKKNKKYYTLSRYAQSYMKIPGLAEKELRIKLAALKTKYKSFEALNLFPKKDTMDFSVFMKSPLRDVCNLLDVKDHLNPEGLAKIVIKEHTKIKSKVDTLIKDINDKENLKVDFIIIIPDYLLKKDKDYKKVFEESLIKIREVDIKIKTVSDYCRDLKTLLKKLDKEIEDKKNKEIVQLNLLD